MRTSPPRPPSPLRGEGGERQVSPLPPDWRWVKLGEVCSKIQDGSHFSPQVQHDEPGKGRFKYITAKNIRHNYMDLKNVTYVDREFHESIYSRCNPEFGDVLLTKDGVNTGQVTLNTLHEPFSLLSSVCIFKTNKSSLSSQLLKYFIQSPFGSKAITDSMTGTAIKRIILRKIKEAYLPLPPLATQQAIVAKIEELFSELDKGIESIRLAQQQLKTYRQSVLKAAFEGTLTPSPSLRERGEKEGLPAGWKWVKLGEISENIQYGYTESSSQKPIGPKFLRITDIQDNRVNWAEVPYCKISKDKIENYLLQDGDLVFARTGATVGKSFLIRGEIPESVFASYLIRVRVNKASVSIDYIAAFFHSLQYWQQITEGQVGIGQPNVNGTKLAALVLPLPPLAEQQAIVAAIESRLSVADQLEATLAQSLQQAEALRQSVLKKAFSGELVGAAHEPPLQGRLV